jgi:hypothetical protein
VDEPPPWGSVVPLTDAAGEVIGRASLVHDRDAGTTTVAVLRWNSAKATEDEAFVALRRALGLPPPP